MRDAATERWNAASRLGRRRREISTKRKKDTILPERSQERTANKGVSFFKSAKQTVFGLQKTHFEPKIMARNRRFVPPSRHRDRVSGGALLLLAHRLAVRMVQDFGHPAWWAFPKQILSASRAGGTSGAQGQIRPPHCLEYPLLGWGLLTGTGRIFFAGISQRLVVSSSCAA